MAMEQFLCPICGLRFVGEFDPRDGRYFPQGRQDLKRCEDAPRDPAACGHAWDAYKSAQPPQLIRR